MLESLTLVAAEINAIDVAYLRHYRRVTPLAFLHLDHCDISYRALETIMSLPKALQGFELQEYNYNHSYKYGLTSSGELTAALVHQSHSLRHLHLGFRQISMILGAPLEVGYFVSLQTLTVECLELDDLLDALLIANPAAPAAGNNVLLIAGNNNVPRAMLVGIILPDFALKIMLQTPPGYIPSRHSQYMIEHLGQIIETFNIGRARVQLVMVRLTEMVGAVPPYLYDEHIPEKVICYDSFAPKPKWDIKTKAEIRTEEEFQRLRHAGSEDISEDFMLGQLNSA